MNKILYFLFLYIFCFVSCKSETDRLFSSAESLMDAHPDSALILLKKVDAENLTSQSMQAKFALLYSHALEKNYIDVTNDSLINIAFNYYDRQKNSHEKMLANYLLARVYYNNESYVQSQKHNLKAKSIAKDLGNEFYVGLVNYNLYDIYTVTHQYAEALKAAEESIDAFRRADKLSYLDWAFVEKATVLLHNDSIETAKHLLDSIYCNALVKGDSLLAESCNHLYISYYIRCKDQASRDSVLEYKNRVKTLYDEDRIKIASYYMSVNEMDSARIYLEQMNPGKTDYATNFNNYELARYYHSIGDSDRAYEIINKTMEGFVNTFESFLQNGISSCQSDFYKSIAEEEREKSEKERNLFVFFGLAVLILAVFAYIQYRKRLKRNREELAATMEMATALQKEIGESRKSSDLLKEKVSKLLQKQFEPLSELCEIYFHAQYNKQKENDVYKKVKTIVQGFQQEEKQNEIMAIIDKYGDNIVTRIFEDASDKNISFTQREKSLLLFVLSGFHPTTISFLLNLSMTNYYTTKSRLKNKLHTIDTAIANKVLINF